MTAKKSKKQVRVYLDPEEDEMLATALKTHPKITESDLLTWLTSAGLKALKDNNYRFPMPLVFKVSDSEETPLRRVTEPTAKGRK